MINKFRKKPITIEAAQYHYPLSEELRQWLGDSAGAETKDRHPNAKGELCVHTLEDGQNKQAKHVATDGDYIIKGVSGEFYPCKSDIFNKTYEMVQS